MFVLYSPSNPSLELLFLQDKVVQSRAATVALTVSWSWVVTSSETQGQSVGPGEKAQRKFSNTGGRAPGYLLLPDHFQTVKQMLAPGWAQKMLCIVVPNRRTISPESFSWVRTRRLLSRHSCPVRSPSFPNQTKELPMSRRFGRYQQEQFNLQWENSVSEGSQCIVNNRKFKMRRRQEIKNSNSLTKQNNNFARASRFYISLPSLRDYHVKMPSFTFCEGRKQAMSDKIFFLFMNLDMVDRNSAPEEFACI